MARQSFVSRFVTLAVLVGGTGLFAVPGRADDPSPSIYEVHSKLIDSRHRESTIAASMAMLHFQPRETRVFLSQVVTMDWPRLPRAELKSVISETLSRVKQPTHPDAPLWKQIAQFPEESRTAFDWESKREDYLELLTTCAEARRSDNPAAVWRKQIASTKSELHAWVYLLAVAGRQAGTLDPSVLQPLTDDRSLPLRELTFRVHQLLTHVRHSPPTVIYNKPTQFDELTVRMRAELLTRLAAIKLTTENPHHPDLYPVIQGFSELFRLRVWDDDFQVKRILCRQWDQRLFTATVKDGAARDWLKSKPFQVPAFQNQPLREVIAHLWLMPLFATPETLDHRVTSPAVQGPWLNVLDEVLEHANCRITSVDEEVILIVRKEDLAARDAWLRRQRAKLPRGDGESSNTATGFARRSFMQLEEDTALKFVDTPLADVAVYFSDLHKIDVIATAKLDAKVNLEMQSLPMWFAIATLCDQLQLDWCVGTRGVVIGSEKDVEQARQCEERIRRHKLRELAREHWSTDDLETDLPGSLRAMSLDEFQTICGKEFPCPLFITRAAQQARLPPTPYLHGVVVGQLAELPDEFDWDADEHVVFVGERAQARAHAKAAENREERRRGYPDALAKSLVQPVACTGDEERLGTLLARLSKASKLTLRTTDKWEKQPIRLLAIPDLQLPLDEVLDLLAAEIVGTWRLQDGVVEVRGN